MVRPPGEYPQASLLMPPDARLQPEPPGGYREAAEPTFRYLAVLEGLDGR